MHTRNGDRSVGEALSVAPSELMRVRTRAKKGQEIFYAIHPMAWSFSGRRIPSSLWVWWW
jgi:hypothetical protein